MKGCDLLMSALHEPSVIWHCINKANVYPARRNRILRTW